MEKLKDYRNIHLAYLRVRHNYMNIELKSTEEEQLFQQCIPKIYEDIRLIFEEGTKFEFSPLEQLKKPKKKNDDNTWQTRPIVRMNFFDSVVAQAVTNVLAEQISYLLPSKNYGYKFQSVSSPYMYQYWKNGYSKYIELEIEAANDARYTHVIEADIEQFYPSINKEKLLEELRLYLEEDSSTSSFINWIEKILNIPTRSLDKDEIQIENGLPQGSLYSPLLAMFFIRDCLSNIDREFKRVKAFSYVDDIRIYCETKKEAEEVLEFLQLYIEKRGLSLNEEKTDIFGVEDNKKREVEIMGRASNLNRAIRDDVILTANGKEEMKSRLQNLFKDAEDVYESDSVHKSKFRDRLKQFVDYRIVRLLENAEEWETSLNENINVDLKPNFVALWHVLFLGANTWIQKREFVTKIRTLLEVKELKAIDYVSYVATQYLFRWSPIELRYSEDEISAYIDKFLMDTNVLYLKAGLSKIHMEWLPYIKKRKEQLSKFEDVELKAILYCLNLIDNPSDMYKKNRGDNRLVYNGDRLIHTSESYDLADNYLQAEIIKNITYKKFEHANNKWNVKVDNDLEILKDINLSEEQRKSTLRNLFLWLDVQFSYGNKRVPCSVVHPEYVWINKSTLDIYLYGNPVFEHDIFYYESPKNIWKESLIALFETIFNLNLQNGINIYTHNGLYNSLSLSLWQYRLLKGLYNQSFSIESFVKFALEILNDNTSSSTVSYEQLKLDHLLNHYINEDLLRDSLLVVSCFVEDSWKNGAKECNFYTLHNHEHARYLITKIHEIVEKSGFTIYINEKEAFRLFAACYLHDIGMLSSPSKDRLYNTDKRDINGLINNVKNILQVAASREDSVKNILEVAASREEGDNLEYNLQLPYIYDIHSYVELIRETIVRDEHPFVSEKELVGDYPKLPLSTAQRRDIGIISSAHGKYKSDVNQISEELHDGKHPIRLKLLSLLLRLADLSDVSKERVKKEVLERNYTRMSNVSVFHWIKHLSVDRLYISSIDNKNEADKTVVQLIIEHNYLPSGKLDKGKLEERCGEGCKMKLKDDGLEGGGQKGFFEEGVNLIQERDGYIKYFDRNICNITCAFINEAYKWFFAEVIYLNKYFKERNINIEIDLAVKLKDETRKDFYYIENRNSKESAQEFLFHYYHTHQY